MALSAHAVTSRGDTSGGTLPVLRLPQADQDRPVEPREQVIWMGLGTNHRKQKGPYYPLVERLAALERGRRPFW